jgi:hypothetical protein
MEPAWGSRAAGAEESGACSCSAFKQLAAHRCSGPHRRLHACRWRACTRCWPPPCVRVDSQVDIYQVVSA